ncbi:hypothetical protein [Streptomyces gilvosporeus]|uniref:Uncharacterized protein n=1 Tax=Streptomyces gilvosporeus TaxID=553510 RepID=A0A1V0TRN1_9ACTN|nr:hypothetical protein [Streptomyces gilvosporeus]ARF55624.1 hypothetical protein B1H19_16845 [Streptomyces gilvosporeus]
MPEESPNTELVELIPLWFTLPEGFHPVDLSSDAERRMEAHYNQLEQTFPSVTPEQLVAAVLSYEAIVGEIAEEGLVHLSSFMLRTEDDTFLSGLCQISVVDRAPGDANLYPRKALETHPDSSRGLQKGIVELPAGVAAVVVSAQEAPLPGAFFGVEDDSVSQVLSATFQIAFPHLPQAAIVNMSTENLEAQEEFLELATLVAAGISFTAPQTLTAPEAEARAAMASPFG